MVQYVEHETLVDELVSLETFSPEERLAHAKTRRQAQLKLYDTRESRPELYPNHHASHNKNIRFEKNIELIEAASRNDSEEVERLMSQHVSPDLQNEDGLSALHQAVIEDCGDVVETLINAGANLNIKDADLWTPLHAAVACGNYSLVQYLAEKGASLVEINTDGNMPIDLVEDMEDIEVFLDEAMTKAGYNQDKLEEIRNETANIMLAELRDYFHEGGDLNSQGEQGESVMHIAAANGYDEVVEYLLDHGAKIDVVDHDKWQPIHAAACWGHDKIIEILVNHGADLDAVTKDGETPYDLTEDEELQGMIIELKESGTKTRELKRSQSNSSRTLSVRRTSIVEKHKISVNDAKQEGIFRQNPDFLQVVINTGDDIEEEEGTNHVNGSASLSPEEKEELNGQASIPVTITVKQPNDQPQNKSDEGQQIVSYQSKEEKITIETDDEGPRKPLNSSDGQDMVGVEGNYVSKDEHNDDAVNTNDVEIDVDLGEAQSHNTAAVKKADNSRELTQSADMSVKKKCCTIL